MPDNITGTLNAPANIVGSFTDKAQINGTISAPNSMVGKLNSQQSVDGFLSDAGQQISGRLNNMIIGTAGTSNYAELENKPQINGVELVGNKTTSQLGINIPTKTSQLTNDSGFITSETDPTVPAWAKQPNKPTYTANEVGALPDNTFIPTKTSDLDNDSGFITGYTETDPVYSASPSASITSSDISNWNNKSDFSGNYNDLTNKPTIPANTSDLNNDSNFVSDANYVHTDNNYTTTEKTKLSGIATGAEVNVQANWTETNTSSDAYIQNKPTLATVATSGSYTDLSNKPTIPTKTSDLTNDSGFISEWVHALDDFSMEDYDWDFGEYLNDIGLVESGFYKAHDTVDDFDYYIIVERAGNEVYQEYWYSEDSSTYRQIRSGYYDGEEWSFDDWDSYMTANNAYNDFALKNHTHYIEETVNYSNILTYFNTFNLNKQIGQYKIINTNDRNVYYLTYDYRYISGLSGNYRLYQEYVTNTDDYIHIRFGTRNGNSIVWGSWKYYPDENNITNNYYNMDYIDETYYTKDEVDDLISGGGGGGGGLIETTWANLVELRDNAELVKGAYYRITDYNFVTTKLDVQSGNHQFDIVVLAISESMLSESAYAVKHAGDHYFEREVTEGGIEWLYTMYVDEYGENYGDEPMDHQDDLHSSDEFCDSGVLTHPNTGDDVPVLYKTDTGEYDIDDPDYDDAYFYEGTYDLDGDEYDMWSKYEQEDGEWVFKMQYALTPIVVEDGELIVSPIPSTKTVPVNMNAWELKYCLDNDKDLFDWAETEGKGVIYYLKDEFGNEAPYDFKNVMFRRYQVSTVDYTLLNNLRNLYLYQDGCYGLSRNNNSKYWYTFASSDGTTDGSLFGECTYNTIEPYIYLSPKGKNIKGLNNIVLQNANRNELGYNCFDITLLTAAGDNKLYYCHDICGQAFSGNEISTNCYGLTFDRTSNSHYGDGTKLSYGRSADAAKTGSGCMSINFGDSCVGMELGNSCNSISFGQWCYNNNIGSGSNNITTGNYCSYINVGKMCTYITFTNYYRYIDIEDNVARVDFTTTGGSTTYYVQYVKVSKGVTGKSLAPNRRQSYEQNYYTNGRIETAV